MIIVGDVHGCLNTLKHLIEQFPKNEKIVFVGDLIDRGNYSRQVVDLVINGGHDCVLGNHEKMMIDSEAGIDRLDAYLGWLRNGGIATLDSYRDFNGKMDKESFSRHIEWMKRLPLYLEYPEVKNEQGEHLLVTHSAAGNVWHWSEETRQKNKSQFDNSLIWGRHPNMKPIAGIYNVFGHTPIAEAKMKSFYANLDTGAVYKNIPGYGKLTALQFPQMQIFEQKNIDTQSFYFEG